MKKNLFLLLFSFSALLFACADQSANTDTKDNDTLSGGTATDSRTTPPATPPEEYSAPPSKATTGDIVKDTARTSISVGKDGASVKTKKGTDVSYDKNGVKIERKDVKIDVKRDTL